MKTIPGQPVRYLLKALGYITLGGFTVLIIVFVLHLNGRPDLDVWHEADLDAELPVEEPGAVRRTVNRSWKTLGEIAALPLQLVFTIVATPIDYAYIQTRALVTRPVGHVRDTLAQLPIVEIPIEGLDHLLGRDVIYCGNPNRRGFTSATSDST